MPFYPTPDRDDGYDITDYLAVDPRLGDLGDVVDAIRPRSDRGLRVIVDLVVNHTSDKHPWFRAARADRSSPYRDYYVWSDDPASEQGTPRRGVVDVGTTRPRQFYPTASAFQPDLNIANPAVRDEIAKIVGFWLAARRLGLPHGRRAVPRRGGRPAGRRPRPGQALAARPARVRERRRGEAMLMGEANVAIDGTRPTSTIRRLVHLQLGFLINSACGCRSRAATRPPWRSIRDLRVPPHDAGWGTFLRNHDELTLDKLTDASATRSSRRSRPGRTCASTVTGSAAGAASMLGGDGPRLRMASSLLFAPRYARRPLRRQDGWTRISGARAASGVRSPMDWDAVAEQRRTPDSLLGVIRRLAHQRRETPELGWGASTLIESEPAALFAHRADWQDSTVYAVHNLWDEPVAAELDLGGDATGVNDLLELRERRVEGGRLRVELGDLPAISGCARCGDWFVRARLRRCAASTASSRRMAAVAAVAAPPAPRARTDGAEVDALPHAALTRHPSPPCGPRCHVSRSLCAPRRDAMRSRTRPDPRCSLPR